MLQSTLTCSQSFTCFPIKAVEEGGEDEGDEDSSLGLVGDCQLGAIRGLEAGLHQAGVQAEAGVPAGVADFHLDS